MEPLMPQQIEAFNLAYNQTAFAIFHAMGTGKTRTAIELINYKVANNLIDALVVICPLSITLVWEEQAKLWGLVNIPKMFVGVESLSQGGKAMEVLEFLGKFKKPAVVIDESITIKNFKAVRTKRCWEFGRRAKFRIIMTGLPITQGIHDLFAQFFFLDPAIIGEKSFYTFRNKYCILGGFQGKQIKGYQNKEELIERMKPYCHVVTKEQAMPYLPPRVFEKIIVEPTPEQKKVMISLKDLFMAEYKGAELEVSTVLERLMRYQQIVGGHFPTGNGMVTPMDSSPKMKALNDLIDTISENEKVIIWARFVPEIHAIHKMLCEKFGSSTIAVKFWGNDLNVKRQATEALQTGNARFLISSQQSGGKGQTWTEASIGIYYSNTFSLDDREQSQDRNHRKGSEKHESITYVDIMMNHPIDKLIVDTLNRKKDMAQWVKDQLSSE